MPRRSNSEPPEDWADAHVAQWKGWDELPFDPDVEAAATRIGMLHNAFRRAKHDGINETGIDLALYETLHALGLASRDVAPTATVLCERLQISPAGMTGRLDRLEGLGYVERRRTSDDRRRVELFLTREGRRVWKASIRHIGDAEHGAVHALTVDERRELNRLLKKMLAATGYAQQPPRRYP